MGTTEEHPSVVARDVFAKGEFLQKSYFAVIDPLVLNDSIPKDMQASMSNQKVRGLPVKLAFDSFDNYEAASHHSQKLNRPLVILEIKPIAKVVPVLPEIQKLIKS